MTTMDWAICAFIAIAVGLLAWKGGAANPEGTGRLGKNVNEIRREMTSLHSRVGGLEHEVEEIKRDGATVKDIARLEERIQTVRAEASGHREVSQRTNASVDRIERLLIERGFNK